MGGTGLARSEDTGARLDHDREWPTEFVQLYRSQYAPMVRLAYLLTGSRSLAEELVQDAFLRVRPHLDRVHGLEGYLRTTVVNSCANQRRRAALERRYSQSPEFAPQEMADPTDEVGDVLARLPCRQRSVLVMRYYLGLSELEIARELGCRPGTVKSLAHRGLLEMRRLLQQ